MDLQELQALADKFSGLTCIMSVEKKPDGGYGVIRIETGNATYKKSFLDAGGVGTSPEFVPGQNYEVYIKKDLNFEDFCYRAAVLKKPMHAYVHTTGKYNVWYNMTAVPLESDDPNIGYCTYTLEFSKESDLDLMAEHSAKITSDVLKICIKLREASDFRKTMRSVAEDFKRLCGAGYCCVLLTDFKKRVCSVLGESTLDSGEMPSAAFLKDEKFIDYAASWMDLLAGSNCIIIKDKQDMDLARERCPEWYESMRNADVESLVLFPLMRNNEPLGFIWVTNFNTQDSLRIKETLELATFFLSSEVASYQLMKQLELLSAVDLLTGVKNRNAMNNLVTDMVDGVARVPRKYGIVFADLNGLKQVNDNEGHEAGDLLLRRAACVLKEAFKEFDVYRAGGDEFIIIASDADKDDLERRVESLRRKSDVPGKVSFALGLWYEDQGGDIRKAMHNADEAMYMDKRRYYQGHPDEQR